MLQMSQIEKPRCSATIDQMRLRWAMNLPVDFQNVSSSGFHSKIQLGLRLLIKVFLSGGARPREPKTMNAVPRRSKAFLPGRRRCLFSARQDARRQQRRRRRFRFTSSVPTGGAEQSASKINQISRLAESQRRELKVKSALRKAACKNFVHAKFSDGASA